MAHHDESLIDKVKNALGMGHDHDEAIRGDSADGDDRAGGWAGVPEATTQEPMGTAGDERGTYGASRTDEPSGLGRNPGPVGSAQYEGGATPADMGGEDVDADGGLDTTREDRGSGDFGGAYGEDDTPMPTSAAWDRGEAAPARDRELSGDDDLDRRGTGV